jgi:hypothetical protein
MILSHRWHLVFIKGRKVAGTSVEIALSTLCGGQDVVTPITPRDEIQRLRAGGRASNFGLYRLDERRYLRTLETFVPEGSDLRNLPAGLHPGRARFYNHMPLTEVIARHGDLAGYTVFCVERSPYSKVLSWANMAPAYAAYETGAMMATPDEEVTRQVDAMIAKDELAIVRNIDLYRWPDGRVDLTVLRYGDLAGGFDRLLRRAGIAPVPALPHAKRGLLADGINPRRLLRPDQIERINAVFAEEFETFGYDMLRP